MKIERILANNPGVYTGSGTNTWLLDDGHGTVVVIDPGPVDTKHGRAIVDRIADRTVEAILVTHTHVDHAPLANPLAKDLAVPALGHAPGLHFEPDERLLDGARIALGTLEMMVVHTPGHSDDHLCFRVGNALFSGDHIMGGSSVMVDDMGPYLRSLEKLKGTGLDRIHPGHGEEMAEPDKVIDWYLAHRRQRHEEVYRAVADGHDTTKSIVEMVYADVDSSLHPLAARSVAAHLTLLNNEGRIVFEDGMVLALPNHE